jgi:hypothetical protein
MTNRHVGVDKMRSFLVMLTGLATSAVLSTALAQEQPSQAYPDAGAPTDIAADIAGSQAFRRAANSPFKFITLTFENDVFVGQDDGFTNGFGLTFGRGPFLEFTEKNLPPHLDFLTRNLEIQTKADRIRGVAHMLFQHLQTPQDITIVELQENDKPYAGFLAWQSTLFSWDTNVSDQVSLTLGLVGPATFGEQTQEAVHRAIGSEIPVGWDNQLENEFVFQVEAQRVRKFYRNYSDRFGIDILGLKSASLGTVQSAAKLGLAVRWGTSLEFSHATFALEADRQVNALALSERNDFFVYLGARASLVLNDVLVDGNTFTDSHSVPLEHFQNQISGGLVWKFGSLAYVFQLTSSSAKTTALTTRDTFGALSVTYPFR